MTQYSISGPAPSHTVGRVWLHPEVPLAHKHLLEVVAVAERDELVQGCGSAR